MQTLYPKSEADLVRIFEVAKASGLTLHWGGALNNMATTALEARGSSVNTGLKFDLARHLNQVLAFDAAKRLIMVQPGVTLSQLNSIAMPHGLYLPIRLHGPTVQTDPTIDDLIHANAKGTNFLQDGRMVHYVAAIDAVMADASLVRFSTFGDGGDMVVATVKLSYLIPQLFIVASEYQAQIAAELGAHPWRKNGYNLDIFDVSAQVVRLYNPNKSLNLAHLLVGSFGQLALPKRITLRLAALPKGVSNAALVPVQPALPLSSGSAFSLPIMEAFGRVKQLFDPENRLNPVGAAFLGMKPE